MPSNLKQECTKGAHNLVQMFLELFHEVAVVSGNYDKLYLYSTIEVFHVLWTSMK